MFLFHLVLTAAMLLRAVNGVIGISSTWKLHLTLWFSVLESLYNGKKIYKAFRERVNVLK